MIGRAAVLSVFALVLVAACEREEILLLTIEADAGAPVDAALPDAEPPGPSCEDDRGCAPNTFCAKARCGDPSGHCEKRPSFCGDAPPAPVCACDGVTYWNDCVRKTRGQPAAFPGECPVAKAAACDDRIGKKCPKGAMCAKLAPAFGCSPDVAGYCWVVPPTCPAPTGVDRFVKCGPTPEPECVDLCAAIKSGVPHASADSCP